MKKILSLFVLLLSGLLLVSCGDSLPSPKNLKIDNHILTWDQVKNADKYLVEVASIQEETTTNQFDLSTLELEPGDYKVGVKAVFGTKVSNISKKIDYIVEEVLMTPKNIKVTGTTLSFDSVDDATSYVLLINGKEYTITGTTFDLGPLNLLFGGHKIKVKAINETKSSAFSAEYVHIITAGVDETVIVGLLKMFNNNYRLNMKIEDFYNELYYEVYLLTVKYIEAYIEAAAYNNLKVDNLTPLFEELTRVLINDVDFTNLNALFTYIDGLQGLGLTGNLLGQIIQNYLLMSLKIEKSSTEDWLINLYQNLQMSINDKEVYKQSIGYDEFVSLLHTYAKNEKEHQAIDGLLLEPVSGNIFEITYIINNLYYDINFEYNDDYNSYAVYFKGLTEVFRTIFASNKEEDKQMLIEKTEELHELYYFVFYVEMDELLINDKEKDLSESEIYITILEEERENINKAFESIYEFLVVTKETLNSEQFITIINKAIRGEDITVTEIILLKTVMLPVIKNSIPSTADFLNVYKILLKYAGEYTDLDFEALIESAEDLALATTTIIDTILGLAERVDLEYFMQLEELKKEDDFVVKAVFYSFNYFEEYILSVMDKYDDILTEEAKEKIFIFMVDMMIETYLQFIDGQDSEYLHIFEFLKDNYQLISSITNKQSDKLFPLIKLLENVYEASKDLEEGDFITGLETLMLAAVSFDNLIFGDITSEYVSSIIELITLIIAAQTEFLTEEEINSLIDILLSLNEIKTKLLVEASKLDISIYFNNEDFEGNDVYQTQFKAIRFIGAVLENTLTTETKEEINRLVTVLFNDILTNEGLEGLIPLSLEAALEMIDGVYQMIDSLASINYDDLTSDDYELLEYVRTMIFGERVVLQ